MNSKGRLRLWLTWVAGVVLLAALVYYLYHNADRYVALLRISARGVAAFVLMALIMQVVNGLIQTYTFRGLGASLSHAEGLALGASATLANQLPLPGGLLTRAVYLRHRHGLGYTEYIGATLALVVCSVCISGLTGTGIVTSWTISESAAARPVLLIAFALMAASGLAFLLPVSALRRFPGLHIRVAQLLEGWRLISENRILLLRVLGLQTGLMLLLAARYGLAFRMLSQAPTASQLILMAAASVLTQLVSIAPGGLGVRETIVGAVAYALGLDLPVSVAAVSLDRLITTAVIVTTGVMGLIWLGNRAPSAETKCRA